MLVPNSPLELIQGQKLQLKFINVDDNDCSNYAIAQLTIESLLNE